mgnify:CR=1 FL=1|tara:strand:- start:595 stop:849 length:255 start_codon:yes stop_codon:yes gene_type:complete
MCLFRTPKPTAMATPPPVAPRVNTDTALPKAKPTIDPEDTAQVKYGTGQKKDSPGAAKKTGTDSLKINLNTGGATGSSTGGMNV